MRTRKEFMESALASMHHMNAPHAHGSLRLHHQDDEDMGIIHHAADIIDNETNNMPGISMY